VTGVINDDPSDLQPNTPVENLSKSDTSTLKAETITKKMSLNEKMKMPEEMPLMNKLQQPQTRSLIDLSQ
jgi:hypothetical protein